MKSFTYDGETFRPRPDLRGSPFGAVWAYPDPPANGFDELLYDFDIDGAELKAEHIAWLDTAIDKVKSSPALAWRIYLDAYATRTGSKRHNDVLTKLREKAVESYLRDNGLPESPAGTPQVHYDMTSWVGFDETTVVGEDKTGRSVRVVITKEGLPKPKPQPLPSPIKKPSVSGNYLIRCEGSVSAAYTSPYGIAVGGDGILFRIFDPFHHEAVVFLYTGVDIGLSLPWRKSPPVSTSLPSSDWTGFLTNKEIGITQFEGPAKYQSAGWLKWSANVLYIDSLPAGVTCHPNPIPFSTGVSPMPSTSNGIGRLNILSGPFPFAGP